MPTTFPRDIKLKELKAFNGTAADLESFDNGIKLELLRQNLPLYYRGYVRGNPDTDYEYVSPNSQDSKSNYTMGRRLCAGLAMKLEGDAKKWWEDYDEQDNESPNCWKKHKLMKRPIVHGNGGIEEISQYELLKKQFSREVDARAAEIELGKYKWELFKKNNSQSVTAFRTHTEGLMKRAQKTDSFTKMRIIRNALPNNIKEKTEIGESEEELWKCIRRIHITMEVDELDRGIAGLGEKCNHYGKSGHMEDQCRKKKQESLPVGRKQEEEKKDPSCTRWGRAGHLAAACFAKKHKDGSALAENTLLHA